MNDGFDLDNEVLDLVKDEVLGLVKDVFDLKDEVLDLIIVKLGRLRVEIRCFVAK